MTQVATHGVKLTDTAVSKVRSLLEGEGRDDLRLRVSVQPGGCSGLIYQLFFDEQLEEIDAVVDFGGSHTISRVCGASRGSEMITAATSLSRMDARSGSIRAPS